MTIEYTHQESASNLSHRRKYFLPKKEVRLNYGEGEVLYVTGPAVTELSCCTVSNSQYAVVLGHIVNWQSKKDKNGLPVSELESVADEKARADIRQLIKGKENIAEIEFW